MSERTHRHKLEKNILADWLAEKGELLRPYAIPVTVGGIVAVVAIVGLITYLSWPDTVGPRAWEEYFTAFGEKTEPLKAEALKAAIDKGTVKGTPAELWARLAYADTQIQAAITQLVEDRKKAETALAQGEKTLKEIEGRTTDPELLARSRFSLGHVYETQNKLDEARKYYEKVAETSKDSTLGKEAANHVKRLKSDGEVAELLAWLDKQEIQPKTTPGGSSPFFQGFNPAEELPERPNLSVPGAFQTSADSSDIDFGQDKPGTAPGTTEGNTSDSKAKTDEPPAQDEKPAEADSTRPGDEPAKEKPAAAKEGTEPANDAKPAPADGEQP